jgi:hypothetical protein
MARERNRQNGRLEEALETLARSDETMPQILAAIQQTQATMVHTQAAFLAQMTELKVEADRRFARIEAILLDHSRILQEHSQILREHGRILQALPDAVRDKIGFKSPGQST